MRFAPLSVFRRGRLTSSALLCLCASAFADPGTPDATAKRVRALRADGTRLLHEKQVPAACRAFESAAQLAPSDPDVLVDLALCEQRRGNDERARARNLAAIALASAPEQIDEPHFERVRRSAYFNIDQLPEPSNDASTDPPANQDPNRVCAQIPAEPGCSKTFTVCSKPHESGGPRERVSQTIVRLALNEADASFEDGEDLNGDDFDDGTASAGPRRVAFGNSLTFDGTNTSEHLQYVCEAEEWSCEKSAALATEAEQCTRKTGPGSETHCQELVCARANDRPSPAVRREQRAAEQATNECYKSCADSDESHDCNVAYANACTGLVGIVCHGRTGQAIHALKRVEEVAFELDRAN